MPFFKHDCPYCRFVGHYKGYDLYIHWFQPIALLQGGLGSQIARFGDRPEEYLSTLAYDRYSVDDIKDLIRRVENNA